MNEGAGVDVRGRNASDQSDAHGHAALMLLESLIHTLVERSILKLDDALEAVSTAIDAAEEMANDRAVRSPALDRSVALLNAISSSLALEAKS